MQPTTIHLIRHGDVHNPDQILYGRLPDFRLSDKGLKQAAGAAEAMRERSLAAFFASPQQRAQETASIIIEHHPNLDIRTEPRVDEIHSPHQGSPLSKLEAMGWDLYLGVDEAYEQPAHILQRTRDFIADVRVECSGSEVAVVTHGDVIAFMIMFANNDLAQAGKKVNFTKYGLPEIYPNTASITTFTYNTVDPEEIPAMVYKRPY